MLRNGMRRTLRDHLRRTGGRAPLVRDPNVVFEEHLTPGERAADRVASIVGSWPFIIAQSVMLVAWVAINVAAWTRQWDPYPFILMNLLLSLQAAYAAPIIMMSQNRQASKDRLEAHMDFVINQKAEEEVRLILEQLEELTLAVQRLEERVGRTSSGPGVGSPPPEPSGT